MRQLVLGISVLCLSLSSEIQQALAQSAGDINGATIELAQASPKQVKQAIVETYKAIDDALTQGDVKRYGSFIAPEYTSTLPDKSVKNRQQMLQKTTENFRVFRQLKVQTQLKQVKIDGKTATVNGVMNIRAVATNPDNPQETRAFAAQQSFQDVLHLIGQEWKVVTSRTLSQKNQVEPHPNQQTGGRNYDQVTLMGMSAANGCYKDGRLDDCARLERIVTTLATWCETDSQACQVSQELLLYVQMITSGY
jgi:ketosteroid isomerase-like protein